MRITKQKLCQIIKEELAKISESRSIGRKEAELLRTVGLVDEDGRPTVDRKSFMRRAYKALKDPDDLIASRERARSEYAMQGDGDYFQQAARLSQTNEWTLADFAAYWDDFQYA